MSPPFDMMDTEAPVLEMEVRPENCGNCLYWESFEEDDVGVCRIISDGNNEEAYTLSDEFMCARTFYCSLYEANDEEPMAESLRAGSPAAGGGGQPFGGPAGGPGPGGGPAGSVPAF